MRLILVQEFPYHHDEIVAKVDPVAVYDSVGGDAPDYLTQLTYTFFSSFFSYRSLGFVSRLKEDSFPPFSMMLISSLTNLDSSCNFWAYCSVMFNVI